MKTLTDSMPITAMVFNARSLSSGIRVLSTSPLVLLDGTRPVVQDDCRQLSTGVAPLFLGLALSIIDRTRFGRRVFFTAKDFSGAPPSAAYGGTSFVVIQVLAGSIGAYPALSQCRRRDSVGCSSFAPRCQRSQTSSK